MGIMPEPGADERVLRPKFVDGITFLEQSKSIYLASENYLTRKRGVDIFIN